MPQLIDPVFAKTSPKRSFCMTENERFGLVFAKTGSINSGTGCSHSAVSILISKRNYEQYRRFIFPDYVILKQNIPLVTQSLT